MCARAHVHACDITNSDVGLDSVLESDSIHIILHTHFYELCHFPYNTVKSELPTFCVFHFPMSFEYKVAYNITEYVFLWCF